MLTAWDQKTSSDHAQLPHQQLPVTIQQESHVEEVHVRSLLSFHPRHLLSSHSVDTGRCSNTTGSLPESVRCANNND